MTDLQTQAAVIVAGLVRRLGASAMGRRLKLTEGAVRSHAAGESVPRAAARERYHRLYDVPPEAWDQRADVGLSAPPKRRPAPRANTSANGPPSALATGPDDARAAVVDLLRVARTELAAAQADEHTPYSARAQLITSATGLCRLLARLSGELEISESQIARSMPWRRVMACVERALEKHTIAARDVAAAVDEALAGEGR